MKITRIEPILLTAPLDSGPVAWSGGHIPMFCACLVRVHTDAGITGLGETYGGLFAPEAAKAIVEHYETMAIGLDARDVGGVWSRLYMGGLFWGRAGFAVSVLSAIEMALWDINGKALDLPAYKLLGGKVHDRLRIYASGGLDGTADEFRRELDGYLEKGFTAVKIRGGYGPRYDGARARLARETIGETRYLMMDMVQGHNPRPWSAAEAIVVAEAVADADLTWLEEPCAAYDYDGYAKVRAKARMPISGGESSTTLHEFKHFFDRAALDVAQPDAAHCGGMAEFCRIATAANAAGVRVVPHAWGSGPALTSNYHAAFTTANCFMVEFPTIENPLRHALLVEPLRVVDGFLLPPTAPGLGLELTDDVIARYPFNRDAVVRPRFDREDPTGWL
ncbi:MAG: mandelate racemase/muconate lactonizing enzyme family protein [Chelatococcus sp.]|uniref:mandelate racemase/muconate lactonizing enzyme family protein n=1 Tax=Chelatococcus sp. TaxID=1953771 RepID=UPI0025C1D069|nr:mandelate racemase/muconate lactonizing enzyme family protein [Chelatococcus sp.]MBX3538002.1 mandelate racemase/muconate lactonizing enzyme family protein [Chelatococcus sp.]